MLIAIFTDIHGNREALEACLAHAGHHSINRYVFLGDLVGYGADPGFVVDTVKSLPSAAPSRCSATTTRPRSACPSG